MDQGLHARLGWGYQGIGALLEGGAVNDFGNAFLAFEKLEHFGYLMLLVFVPLACLSVGYWLGRS
jgi:hypothetical protein